MEYCTKENNYIANRFSKKFQSKEAKNNIKEEEGNIINTQNQIQSSSFPSPTSSPSQMTLYPQDPKKSISPP
ncbi:MAG: hypothetical protein EZS28_048812, partial [Streblomastix strix]